MLKAAALVSCSLLAKLTSTILSDDGVAAGSSPAKSKPLGASSTESFEDISSLDHDSTKEAVQMPTMDLPVLSF